ncbi:MAG: Flp pilus assembly complex ATPase component TadA, partial [Puniceicoccaceae bacterium]|nr:Flp pilus assembly complex ATPase component TadA [Puniceicoccaceae bacterium]
MYPDPQSGLLFIVSGPAGSGKTTLCERMLAELPEVQRIVTSTTRAPRPGEVDTVDYYFF